MTAGLFHLQFAPFVLGDAPELVVKDGVVVLSSDMDVVFEVDGKRVSASELVGAAGRLDTLEAQLARLDNLESDVKDLKDAGLDSMPDANLAEADGVVLETDDMTYETVAWNEGYPIAAMAIDADPYSQDCSHKSKWTRTAKMPVVSSSRKGRPGPTYEAGVWVRQTSKKITVTLGVAFYNADGDALDQKTTTLVNVEHSSDGTWHFFSGRLLPSGVSVLNANSAGTVRGKAYSMPEGTAFVELRYGACADQDAVAPLPKVHFYAPILQAISPYGGLTTVHHTSSAVREMQEQGNLVTDMAMGARGWLKPPQNIQLAPWSDGRPILAQRVDEITSTNPKQCYNEDWAQSNMIEVDPMLNYELSVYILSTNSDLSNYFGFYVYDSNRRRITAGDYNNPYFRATKDEAGKWEYHNAYLLSSATTASPKSFTVTTGRDFILPPNARYVVMRFGSCYGDNANGLDYAYFAYPRMGRLTTGGTGDLAGLQARELECRRSGATFDPTTGRCDKFIDKLFDFDGQSSGGATIQGLLLEEPAPGPSYHGVLGMASYVCSKRGGSVGNNIELSQRGTVYFTAFSRLNEPDNWVTSIEKEKQTDSNRISWLPKNSTETGTVGALRLAIAVKQYYQCVVHMQYHHNNFRK